MTQSWLGRLCVVAVDTLYGSLLYLPLGVMFLSRSLRGTSTYTWDDTQIPDLSGKVAIVTGGNAGLGYHTVKQLVLKGAKVYLGARSQGRAEDAIKKLLADCPSVPPENLVWLPLDLGDQPQVARISRTFLERETRLDILVHNAGLNPYNYTITRDGLETTMAVNHVGHWTLTYCLLPLLKKTATLRDADVRVVTVSSSGERNAPTKTYTEMTDLQSPCVGRGWEDSCLGQTLRYGRSKRANVLFANELQRRLDNEGAGDILSLSLNPGPVRTEGAATVMPFMVRPLVGLLFTPVEQGVLTQLFAATAREVRQDSARWRGQFLDGPGKIQIASAGSRDEVVARNLWDLTEKAVRATGALDGM